VGADFVVGESLDDLRLLRKYLPEEIQVKAASVTTLDDALAAIEAGATRMGATETAAILDAWKARLAATA
jgi:deoxyribose-phosphate aldolase